MSVPPSPTVADWLERHTAQAPPVLTARAQAYVAAMGAVTEVAEALAHGARVALRRALAQPGDRSAALDLLAADALVTLALVAQAEQAPDRLGAFARGLLRPDLLDP